MLQIMTNKPNPDIILVVAVNTLFFFSAFNNFHKMDALSKLNVGTLFNNANASENVAM